MVDRERIDKDFVDEMKKQMDKGMWGPVQNIATRAYSSEELRKQEEQGREFREMFPSDAQIPLTPQSPYHNLLEIIYEKFGQEEVQELVTAMINGLKKSKGPSAYPGHFNLAIERIADYEKELKKIEGQAIELINGDHIKGLDDIVQSKEDKKRIKEAAEKALWKIMLDEA